MKNLSLGEIGVMVDKEQMKKIQGGTEDVGRGCQVHCCDWFGWTGWQGVIDCNQDDVNAICDAIYGYWLDPASACYCKCTYSPDPE